jgi:WD40 repeat protein
MGGEKGRVQIWRISGGSTFLENRDDVQSLAFSPDGHWLAAGGKSGDIQLWRWDKEKTNPMPIVFTGHKTPVDSVSFTSKGLMSAAGDDDVHLWEVRTDKLIQLACQSAGRTLSKSERDTYLLSELHQEDEPCPGMPKAPD